MLGLWPVNPVRPAFGGHRSLCLGLGLTALVAASCASISKKYESEVRFERCYALDWKKDVDPGIRSRCWEEWVVYFSEGQSLDRIEYAKKHASGAEPVASAAASATAQPSVAQALPQPTSVFSPVPMMAASPSASASEIASTDLSAQLASRSPCQGRCDKYLEGCLNGCGSSVCEHFCAQRHGKCDTKCDAAEKKK